MDIEEKRLVESDYELLEIVWNNLISNAIKFTEPKGSIKISQYIKENKCIVEIKDNGCGMDEKTIKHLFEKFYQGDTSHSMEGNGLGLALVWRILKISNAQIEVFSKVGEGSTFKVSIPLSEELN